MIDIRLRACRPSSVAKRGKLQGSREILRGGEDIVVWRAAVGNKVIGIAALLSEWEKKPFDTYCADAAGR